MCKGRPHNCARTLVFLSDVSGEPHVRSRNTKQSLAGLLPAARWGDESQLVDPNGPGRNAQSPGSQ